MNPIVALLFLFVVSLLPTAFAQSLGLPAGIPAEYTAIVTVIITALTGWLVTPLTAVAKKLGRTEGPTTVLISAVLSIVIALGLTIIQAALSSGTDPLWPAVISALVGWVKANGDYLMRVQANTKANVLATESAREQSGETKTSEGVQQEPLRPSGVEAISTPSPYLNGVPEGARLLGGNLGGAALGVMTGLISSPLLEVAIGLLTSAFPSGVPKGLAERFLTEAVRLAPELLDGDGYVSNAGRQRLNGVLLDIKAGRL
ncbi:hypothetical protein [Deinococcus sp. QL22]|uniref:hypothetical protein n=1 Tax=Deinococcus sp. QL22 TaxID=2939437 RepID=UPI002017D94F|nr:hypothetical protein [Deinococcus sp. QL22]UQN10347.1 hypothetical protein M1R55_29795 [Deinococcus sp. QL22]UQN10481.1 hypothetical protein M1R55_29120 [Deinococcus sp. QL22]